MCKSINGTQFQPMFSVKQFIHPSSSAQTDIWLVNVLVCRGVHDQSAECAGPVAAEQPQISACVRFCLTDAVFGSQQACCWAWKPNNSTLVLWFVQMQFGEPQLFSLHLIVLWKHAQANRVWDADLFYFIIHLFIYSCTIRGWDVHSWEVLSLFTGFQL